MENKALEVFKEFKNILLENIVLLDTDLQRLNIIEKALTTKSKKEQAFDIAAAKCVDMYRLAVADNVVSYNKWTEFDEYWLTEEEFDLIKEVLK